MLSTTPLFLFSSLTRSHCYEPRALLAKESLGPRLLNYCLSYCLQPCTLGLPRQYLLYGCKKVTVTMRQQILLVTTITGPLVIARATAMMTP